MEILTLTALRQRLYEVVDRVIATGVPQEIERKGKRVKIVLEEGERDKFKNLKPHHTIIGNPDDIIHIPVFAWDEVKHL